ncbi:hypothetical protein cand_032510 [Cryptosporidium andersoni]|uniref:Chromatin assembly factor 1 subunit A dimerization domain-containing protein n=1 Tax=Cryptosporidium andersoni TaxID=117008 RepID=A0A1J4MBC6_9CRYT|nr:hypothetical protein cand_032510 [Cryptosporidium andersoni]
MDCLSGTDIEGSLVKSNFTGNKEILSIIEDTIDNIGNTKYRVSSELNINSDTCNSEFGQSSLGSQDVILMDKQVLKSSNDCSLIEQQDIDSGTHSDNVDIYHVRDFRCETRDCERLSLMYKGIVENQQISSSGRDFDYSNGYSYIHTRLLKLSSMIKRYSLLPDSDSNFVNSLEVEVEILCEVLAELRTIGSFNDTYRRFRLAKDLFIDNNSHNSGKVDNYPREDILGNIDKTRCDINQINNNKGEDVGLDDSNKPIDIGDILKLGWLSFQSSASSRKEIKLLDKFIKDYMKKRRESKEVSVSRDIMSGWLHKCDNKKKKLINYLQDMDSSSDIITSLILDSLTLPSSPSILSLFSPSYIINNIYPFMVNMNINDVKYGNNSYSSTISDTNSHTLAPQDSQGTATISEVRSGDMNVSNTKAIQSESVMNWIKNHKKSSMFVDNVLLAHGNLSLDPEKLVNQEDEYHLILSSRLGGSNSLNIYKDHTLQDLQKIGLISDEVVSVVNYKLLWDEFKSKCSILYNKFLNRRAKNYQRQRFYKSIPTIGLSRPKRQWVEKEEVKTRQYQSIYNDKSLPELPSQIIRRVVIYRSDWKRPPMYLLITRKGKQCSGLNPIAREEHIDYDVDTDEEWEEQYGGEDVDDVEDGLDNNDDEDDNEAVASGWLVPDGCFQSDELLEDDILLGAGNGNTVNRKSVNILQSINFDIPLVASFLQHRNLDFGAGISIADENIAVSLLNDYKMLFPQGIEWIYMKMSDAQPDKVVSLISNKITPACNSVDEDTENNTDIKIRNLINKGSILKDDLQKELSYMIHGSCLSTKNIVEEFMRLHSNIKKVAIIRFLKENTTRMKIQGDNKTRWYILDKVENLDKIRLEISLNKHKLLDQNTIVTSPVQKKELLSTSTKRSNIELCEDQIQSSEFITNIVENDENCDLQNRSELIAGHSIVSNISVENNSLISPNEHSGKRRKCSMPKCTPLYTNNDSLTVKIGSSPEIKKSAVVSNNSLITNFFQPKQKN